MVHPFLSFSGEYTDNVFAKNNNTESDFISYITPGVWLALPGADAEVINIASSSSVPGGFAQTRFQSEMTGRYQAFVKYAPTFENYVDFNERDFISNKLDAYAAVNLAVGLSFELMDQFTDSRDGVEEETDSAEFNNNLLGLTTSYVITDKMKARIDLGHYNVNYDSQAPEKDRVDTSVSGYLFFDVLPKTSVFGQVSHVDIDYDTADNDSQEFKVFGGVKYNASGRVDAMGKIGYMSKDLDDTGDTDNTLSFEGTLSYDLSDRTNLSSTARRANKESTTSRYVTESMLSLSGRFSVSTRTSASFSVSVSDEDYKRIDRHDTTYTFSPSVRYQLNNRVFGALAYMWTDTNASGQDTSDQSDYTENSVMVSVTASL